MSPQTGPSVVDAVLDLDGAPSHAPMAPDAMERPMDPASHAFVAQGIQSEPAPASTDHSPGPVVDSSPKQETTLPPGAPARVADPPPPVVKDLSLHVLGPFNSGSSFAEHLFQANGLPATDLAFQQVIFKHYPPALVARLVDLLGIDCSSVRFVALTRDPGVWMDAMQRNRYELVFDELADPCRLDIALARNFYRTYEEHLTEAGLTIDEVLGYFAFDSVYSFWESQYRGFIELGDRLSVTILRYEDLLTDTVRSIMTVRNLLNLPPPHEVVLPLTPSKPHGSALNYLQACEKLAGFAMHPETRPNAAAVKANINNDLLASLNYL